MNNCRVVDGLPIADYHEHPAISKSGLDQVAKSIAHYREYRKKSATRDRGTDAMLLGSLLHEMVLLPLDETDRHESEFVIFDRDAVRTLADRLAYDEAKKTGRVVSRKLHDRARTIAENVSAHVPRKLRTGKIEQSIFWEDSIGGPSLGCRCRPDLLGDETAPAFVVFDLKTTRDASWNAFRRSVFKYRYHVGAAFYMRGVEKAYGRRPDHFLICAAETDPPHNVMLYDLDDAFLHAGEIQMLRDLERWSDYREGATQYDGYYPPFEDWQPGAPAPMTLDRP